MIDLRQGDALRVLREIPDASVDAVVTDPPYSSGGNFRADRTNANVLDKYLIEGPEASSYVPFSGDNRDQRGYLAWSALWLAECYRVARPGSFLLAFTDWRQLPTMTDAVQSGGWVWRGIAVWDKTEAARPERGRFRHQCEYILWATKGTLRADKDAACLPGCFRQSVNHRDKLHPTGKPVPLMKELLRVVPGGTVLDPFMGSGSTGVACAEMGLTFIGVEMEPHYFAVAQERMSPWMDTAPVALKSGLFAGAGHD